MTNKYEHIPVELKKLNQWILWRIEYDAGDKATKIPYQAGNWKRLASHSNPETWSSFETAVESASIARMGIGFVFTKDDPFFGLDVDPMFKVALEDNDVALDLRAMIHDEFPTYCESSPSGKGKHYIGIGKIPEEISAIKDSKYQLEIYDHNRFFTITGNVLFERTQITDCSDALTELVQTFARARVSRSEFVNETDERSVDDIINTVRAWSNGARFGWFMDSDLNTILDAYNNDHSRADLALLNFIGVATKDAGKAVEIFRRSPLWRGVKGGYNTEAKYVDEYLVKWCLNKIWAEQATIEKQRAQEAAKGAEIAKRFKKTAEKDESANPYDIDLPYVQLSNREITLPPGMLGEFIKNVNDATFTPNLPYATAVSLAFLSGICGRGFRFGRSGCNVFTLVAGQSATGKTQTIQALSHLLNALPSLGNMAKPVSDRVITSSAKSAQGIYDHFSTALAGSWMTDECGSMLSALTKPASNGDQELKDAINRLYDAAVPGTKWTLSASRASNDKKGVTCLSMGIAWFTTIEKMYDSITVDEVKDGFLSRFIPVFYEGVLGEDNYKQVERFPPHVEATMSSLLAIVNKMDQTFAVDVSGGEALVTVGIDPEAQRIMNEFSVASRNVARRAQDSRDKLPNLYIALSRIGTTAQRIATVAAVMDNPVVPVIRPEHVMWAVQFVAGRTLDVIAKIEGGEIGSGDSIELVAIVSTVKRLAMQAKDGKVPAGLLHRKLRERAPFRSIAAHGGPMRAVKYALENMVLDNQIARIVEASGGGRPSTFYTMTEDTVWGGK